MFEAYKVTVKVSLLDDVSQRLGLLSGHFLKLDREVSHLQRRLDKLSTWGQFFNATAMWGIGIATPFVYAISKAAELQKQMISIQIATRGTTDEMEKMRGAIEDIASGTIFNNMDVAKMAKMIATGTGLSAKEVQSILPEYAKFADVQYLMKGTPYEKSVTDAIRLAHTAQHYEAKSLSTYLDLLNKASFIVPGDLGEIGHALKYSQGVAKTALGMDDTSMVLLTSFLNRLGFAGSRGGTNLIAAMTRSIPGIFGSGLLDGRSNQALHAMGMADAKGNSSVFKDGHFDAFSWMQHLTGYVQREFARYPEAIARQHILRNFQYAFGTQGSRVVSLLTTPEALEQLKQIGGVFAQLQDTAAMQEIFAEQSVAQKFLNAKNNFITALTELGITLLPAAAAGLRLVNEQLRPLIAWMREHQGLVKNIAGGLILLGGSMAIFGILGGFIARLLKFGTVILVLGRGIAPLLGMGSVIGGVTTGLIGLAGVIGSLAVPLTALGLIGYGAYKLWGVAKDLWHAASPGGRLDQQTALNNQQRLNINPIAPRHSQTVQVNSAIHLDGRKVAQAVTAHQVSAADKAPSYTGRFDGSMTPYPVMLPIGNF